MKCTFMHAISSQTNSKLQTNSGTAGASMAYAREMIHHTCMHDCTHQAS